jgi:hypothetical protein
MRSLLRRELCTGACTRRTGYRRGATDSVRFPRSASRSDGLVQAGAARHDPPREPGVDLQESRPTARRSRLRGSTARAIAMMLGVLVSKISRVTSAGLRWSALSHVNARARGACGHAEISRASARDATAHGA